MTGHTAGQIRSGQPLWTTRLRLASGDDVVGTVAARNAAAAFDTTLRVFRLDDTQVAAAHTYLHSGKASNV